MVELLERLERAMRAFDFRVLDRLLADGLMFTNHEGPLDTKHDDLEPLVFESESFENFINALKARESHEFPSDDELVAAFELAPPGKPCRGYGRTQPRRTPR